MKYPLTIGALVLIGLYVIGSAAYQVANNEQCPVAVEYTLQKADESSAARLKRETERFAKKSGYRFMGSSLEGTLTTYAITDEDRAIVNFNDATEQNITVSFYDCRTGGDGSATGYAWLQEVGRKYL
ncbi:hypothetical protein [Agrilutibacter solisilvae]|uniref:Uncharacterized protein n=1 Tax=Agrilutibacter solisilvae TaxID=2763317 RepID=A0A974Y329_9GAMM|nr:hypothetical protein [Lysobacter solisilvae]QSX79715.1 hypothetical protein I8J32_007725 [Lysobacter solisilvae]